MKMTVLILDDEPEKRKDLSKYLKKEGYEVCTAKTIEDTNKIIQLEKIDFAVIDLKIDYSSDYGGIKAIENINKLQPRAKTIVLSAYAINSEIEDQLKKVTINGFIPKGGEQNYIKAVISEIDKLKAMPPRRRCFVIMPFSSSNSCSEEQWTDIFENMIKPSVEESGFQYDCSRANLVIGNIIRDFLDNLNKADVVIADLTDKNPNVFYEAGLLKGLGKPVILLKKHGDEGKTPFDVFSDYRIEYDLLKRAGKTKFAWLEEEQDKVMDAVFQAVPELDKAEKWSG